MNNDELKTCEVCGKIKHISDFSKSYKHRCKECVAKQTKAKRQDKVFGLRQAVNKTKRLALQTWKASQSIANHLAFRGFDPNEEKPRVVTYDETEILLVYGGTQMDIEEAIDLMRQKGFIEKEDWQ